MSADAIEQAAALWLAREDAGLTSPERAALDAWLAQSSRHKVAYLQLKAAWDRTERLAALKRPSPRAPSPRPGYAYRLALLVAATVVIFFGSVHLPWRQQNEQAYTTLVGGMRTVQLADGSRMELNTNTHVRADVTGKLRIVTLESGEAYFDVIHDARHPFTVYAGNWRITDLGTKFSVFLDGDDVREGEAARIPQRCQSDIGAAIHDEGRLSGSADGIVELSQRRLVRRRAAVIFLADEDVAEDGPVAGRRPQMHDAEGAQRDRRDRVPVR